MASNRYPGVHKRSGAWAWRAQYTDQNGERRSLSGSGFASAKLAGEARAKALQDVANRRPGVDPDVTLQAWLARWVEGHVTTLRPTSADTYRNRIHRICQTSYKDTRLRDLDETSLKLLVAELQEQSPSHTTVAGKLRILNLALDAAVHAGIIQRNPGRAIKVSRKHEKFSSKPWTAEQAQKFLRVRRAVDDPLYALYHTALTTGLRRGELHGLKWEDIDWSSSLVHVRRQRVSVRGKTLESPPKTASSEAPVVLDSTTLDLLRALPRTSEYVFTDPRTGAPYHRLATFDDDFRAACYESGVPTIRFHDLRHTAASLLAKAGVPLAVAQKRLRHWSPAMTEHYTHADDESSSEAAEKLGALLCEG